MPVYQRPGWVLIKTKNEDRKSRDTLPLNLLNYSGLRFLSQHLYTKLFLSLFLPLFPRPAQCAQCAPVPVPPGCAPTPMLPALLFDVLVCLSDRPLCSAHFHVPYCPYTHYIHPTHQSFTPPYPFSCHSHSTTAGFTYFTFFSWSCVPRFLPVFLIHTVPKNKRMSAVKTEPVTVGENATVRLGYEVC